jgi:hypothetical protein
VHNVELNLYKLADLAINSHLLRSLPPAPRSSNAFAAITRAAGGAFGCRIMPTRVFIAALV